MKERWGATPPEFGYKDIIPEFKAENWDPDAWAELFEEVGAKICRADGRASRRLGQLGFRSDTVERRRHGTEARPRR